MGRERENVKRVITELQRRGAWVVKIHVGPYQRPGIPDVLACYAGRFLAIEVKQDTGRVSPLQEYEMRMIRRAKGTALVVRSDLSELRALLDEWDAAAA